VTLQYLFPPPPASGAHEFVRNGRDEHGYRVASGVYFCRLATAEKIERRGKVLLR
jgi:hypothetical protein